MKCPECNSDSLSHILLWWALIIAVVALVVTCALSAVDTFFPDGDATSYALPVLVEVAA